MKIGVNTTGLRRQMVRIANTAIHSSVNQHTALVLAAMMVLRRSQKTITEMVYAVPSKPSQNPQWLSNAGKVDDSYIRTGNLRASAYVTFSGGNPKQASFPQPNAKLEQDYATAVAAAQAWADGGIGTFRARVGYGANYALYVHEGTEMMPGRPWLALALYDLQGPLDMIFRGQLRKAVRQAQADEALMAGTGGQGVDAAIKTFMRSGATKDMIERSKQRNAEFRRVKQEAEQAE